MILPCKHEHPSTPHYQNSAQLRKSFTLTVRTIRFPNHGPDSEKKIVGIEENSHTRSFEREDTFGV